MHIRWAIRLEMHNVSSCCGWKNYGCRRWSSGQRRRYLWRWRWDRGDKTEKGENRCGTVRGEGVINGTGKLLVATALCEKCSYLELFWSVFSCIRTKCGEILCIFPHSVRMQENKDQKNSEHGHFLRNAGCDRAWFNGASSNCLC